MAERDDNPEWTAANTAPLDYAGKLKVARARLGLSQAAFAALIRVPRTSLRNWEQRRTRPDAPARTLIELIHRDPKGMRERLEGANAA